MKKSTKYKRGLIDGMRRMFDEWGRKKVFFCVWNRFSFVLAHSALWIPQCTVYLRSWKTKKKFFFGTCTRISPSGLFVRLLLRRMPVHVQSESSKNFLILLLMLITAMTGNEEIWAALSALQASSLGRSFRVRNRNFTPGNELLLFSKLDLCYRQSLLHCAHWSDLLIAMLESTYCKWNWLYCTVEFLTSGLRSTRFSHPDYSWLCNTPIVARQNLYEMAENGMVQIMLWLLISSTVAFMQLPGAQIWIASRPGVRFPLNFADIILESTNKYTSLSCTVVLCIVQKVMF